MNGRKSRAFRAYQKVKNLKPSRSLFDLSHEVLFSGDMGKLYPVCAMEMSPGDTFHIANESVCRMQPLNAPILHEVSLYTHYFFIPYRILWDEWTKFITGGEDGAFGGNNRSEELPSEVSPELPRWRPIDNSIGSLWDYFGLPTGVVPEGALPVDFLRRAYNRVWNEYYRDENLQEEVAETNETILYRNWKKDYFTSALENQQRGVAPAMPLSGFGFTDHIYSTNRFNINTGSNRCSYTFDTSIDSTMFEQACLNNGFTSESAAITNVTVVYYDVETRTVTVNLTSSMQINNFALTLMVTHLSGSSSDIKDLRVAFNIQRWLELANRGGVRYTEFLRSFFGVSPRDDRLQRPEYIGGTKSPIIISEVLQTSSTDSEPTPQGNMAGHGISASRTYVGSYTAVEYGLCLGLLSVMPTAKYQQGINRQWLRRTKFDFLFPQFTNLSEQAIEGAEVYAVNGDATENRKVWGYNEVYDELRAMPSKICGKMRSVFNYWHLARIFDSKPALNSDFIKCNPSKRIFAVPSEDGFIFNVSNIVRAVRPLPKYGTPGGV